jgi:hypothetical protein
MNKFIRLSTRIINPRHIEQILVSNEKYTIHLVNHKLDGFFMFASGGLNTDDNSFQVCRNKNPTDYDTIRRFIDTAVADAPAPRDIET